MNRLLVLILALITLASCTVSQEPDFLKLDEYKIENINRKEIKLSTNAYFHNPNDVGCEVVKTDIDVFINGLEVSKVTQLNAINLEAGNEFSIPMLTSVPLEKISKDKGGILGGALTTLLNKNIKVEYEGIVTLKKLGIAFDIEIKGEEMLKLSLIHISEPTRPY